MKKIYLLASLIIFAFHTNVKAQDCPNGDFESWTSIAYPTPGTTWFTSNPQSLAEDDSLTVWSVPGQTGTGIHIETAAVGTDTLQAFITNSYGDPTAGRGGVPYSQQPTAITGYYKYNLPGNDSAIIFVLFKKSGTVISVNLFKIRNTAGSISTFTAFSLPLAALATTPDTVIIGATSSNLFGSGVQPGSWLELDELAFTGTNITQSIPDGNFDTWNQASLDAPTGWYANVDFSSNGLTKLSSAYSGHYAVALTSMPNSGGGGGSGNNSVVSPAYLSTGKSSAHGQENSGLPYTLTTDTLTGYYQYTPAGIDSAEIGVNLRHGGNIVGSNGIFLTTAATWTYFQIPFMAASAPDSIRIDIISSVQSATVPGSVLKLDYLQLKSQPLPPAAVHNIPNQAGIIAYPNPTTDALNIKFEKNLPGNISIRLYDMMGRTIAEQKYTITPATASFHIGQLPAGLYFYEVQSNEGIIKDKFIKE